MCVTARANFIMSNQTLDYRCRFASEYAMTEEIDHPLNVYVRQDAIEPLLDEWLGRMAH